MSTAKEKPNAWYALDDDDAKDPREVFANLFESFGDNGGDVRNLIASGVQNLLAHDLRHQHSHRLISQFIFRKDRIAFRQMTQDALDQHVSHLVLQRGNWNDLAPFVLVAVPIDQRQQRRFVFQLVDLVKQKQGGFVRTLDEVEDETIAVTRRHRRIANQCDEIDAKQCILDRRHHPAIQFVTRLMHAGCVDEHDLPFRFRDDALNTEAGRLWFIGNGSDLLPDQSIQQS